jgi:hypothetical protein
LQGEFFNSLEILHSYTGIEKDQIKDILPEEDIKAYYLIRKIIQPDLIREQYFLISENYLIDLVITSKGITYKAYKLDVECIEKSYSVTHLLNTEVTINVISIKLKGENKPITFPLPENNEKAHYRDFIYVLTNLK